MVEDELFGGGRVVWHRGGCGTSTLLALLPQKYKYFRTSKASKLSWLPRIENAHTRKLSWLEVPEKIESQYLFFFTSKASKLR